MAACCQVSNYVSCGLIAYVDISFRFSKIYLSLRCIYRATEIKKNELNLL